jgi:hypothetical protein
VTNAEPCFSTGPVSGSVSGSSVTIGVTYSNLAKVTFTGTIAPGGGNERPVRRYQRLRSRPRIVDLVKAVAQRNDHQATIEGGRYGTDAVVRSLQANG